MYIQRVTREEVCEFEIKYRTIQNQSPIFLVQLNMSIDVSKSISCCNLYQLVKINGSSLSLAHLHPQRSVLKVCFRAAGFAFRNRSFFLLHRSAKERNKKEKKLDRLPSLPFRSRLSLSLSLLGSLINYFRKVGGSDRWGKSGRRWEMGIRKRREG